jgi:hypothetical protein
MTGRVAVAALLVAPLLGCGSKEAVYHYRIPKRELLYAANHVEKTEAPADRSAPSAQPADRLLGAIVPHGAQTWYFKMTGPMDLVASQGAVFRQLIESIRFENEQSPPQWKLPESWKEVAGAGQRLATLSVDVEGQTLEVSVTQLATAPSANSLLDNVNRWRGQMQLPPITEDQLPNETITLSLAGGQATLVNLLGSFASGGTGSAALGHGNSQPPSEPAGSKQ